MTTLREVLAEVAPDKLARASSLPLDDALHDSEGHEAPLLVRVFSAVGTWIGAAMVAVIFVAMEVYEVVPLALLLAIGLFAGAIVLSRKPKRSLAMTQLIWAMALGAHGLVVAAFVELEVGAGGMALTWTLLNIATVFLVWVPSFALVSAVCAVGFATWFVIELNLPMPGLWVALPVAAFATLVWIREPAWALRIGRGWNALAYGLPIGVTGPLTLLSIDEGGLIAVGWGATIASVAMLGLIGVVLWQAGREQPEKIEMRTHLLGGMAVLAVLAARHVPGLSLALLWLLLAHLRRSVHLQAIASIQLAGFLFFFYYQLETTLLLKSLWVLSTGAVLLLGAFLARPRAATHDGREANERRSRWLPALALVALTSGLIVGPTIMKQRVLASGQTVLLELAPVDPRSLIQGDYMALRYAIEDEIRSARGMSLEPWMLGELGTELVAAGISRHGRLVVRLDGGVAHFVRFDDGTPLAEGQLLLEYRLREGWSGSVRVASDSFLFEEGSAELYVGARYGEVVVGDDGEAILVGLRDADKKPLGVRLHPSP